MTSFDFDTPIDRRGTASLKWDRYRGRDIIPLWVADMDFKAPPAVIDALHKRVAHGVFGYTVPPDDLVDLVVQRLQDKYRWRVEPESIVWLPGLVSGFNLVCRSVGEAGDEVMTLIPVYPPFLTAPGLSGRALSTVSLVQDKNEKWGIDISRVEQAVTDRTSLFLLCSPHNPVGRIFSRQELMDIASVCDRHGIVICSDEIHCDLLLDRDKKHIPIAALSPEIADRTITLMAPSKTFNIPGLSCSFAVISNRKLRSRFKRVMSGIIPDVSVFGFEAAIAAYRDGGAWHEALIHYLIGNRGYVEKVIDAAAGLKVNHVEATYLAWIDARAMGMKSPATFFEKAGVGLSDGRDFGGAGFLRLNFGCPRSVLAEALGRITAALETLSLHKQHGKE